MADEVDTEQVVVVAPQETPQPGNLTGGAGKEDLAPGLQETLRLQEGVADDTLHIFAAAECRQLFARLGIAVTDFPMCIERGSEHHTPGIDYHLGKGGKHTARTAGKTHPGIGIYGSEGLQGLAFGIGMQLGTDLFAQTTVDAVRCVDLGIEETFGILTEGDALLRAPLHTGTAAAAFGFFNVYHLDFLKVPRKYR